MFVQILMNTDGYIGGMATFFNKPNLDPKENIIYELNQEDTIILHKLLQARDGVELVKNNEDVKIGEIKLKFNDYQNRTILRRIQEENKYNTATNKSDELLNYITTTN